MLPPQGPWVGSLVPEVPHAASCCQKKKKKNSEKLMELPKVTQPVKGWGQPSHPSIWTQGRFLTAITGARPGSGLYGWVGGTEPPGKPAGADREPGSLLRPAPFLPEERGSQGLAGRKASGFNPVLVQRQVPGVGRAMREEKSKP